MSTPEPWDAGIQHASISDVGMRRANNQDAFACVPADNATRFTRHGHLFVVADGMGAHAAGELASEMAVKRIPQVYLRGEDSAPQAMRTAVHDANTAIHNRGQQNPEFHNMGTTASALAILPEGALIGHVGDSRVYRLRNRVFEQLTFDHSLVWEMEAAGQGNVDVAMSNIPKNVITRSLGPSPEVLVDVEGPLPCKAGDTYLLCSDGLSGQVEDAELGVLLDVLPPQRAVRVMVDLANLRGGPDNITIVVCKLNRLPETADTTNQSKRRKRVDEMPSPILLAVSVSCFVLALLFVVMGKIEISVVAGILAAIAMVVALVLWNIKRQSTAPQEVPRGHGASGNAPYRRYKADATRDLARRLGGTVEALREAAKQKSWQMDWSLVDSLQKQARDASDAKDFREAVRKESEAIMETMRQLRSQQNQAAGDSTIDL